MIRISLFRRLCMLLFIAAIISLGCVNKDRIEKLDYETITSLARSFSYKQIVTAFSAYPWGREKDPMMLMIYCEALVETGKSFPSFLKHPPLPTYISEFAQGYYELLRGERRKALNRFSDLTGEKDGSVWGHIGLLEFALSTENITGMKSLLTRLQALADREASSVPSWAVPYYSAWYYLYSGKFSQVDNIVRKYGKLLDTVTVLTLKVHLLIRENRIEEAKKVIKDMPPEFQNDQNVIDVESDLVELEYGPSQWLKYLHEKHERFPQMWLIEQRYAEALINSGQTQHGIDILRKLSRKRPYDVMIQLDLAENLLYYEKGKEVKDIFSHAFKDSIGVAYYNILLAKIYRSQGLDDKLKRALNLAEKQYPKDPRLLWLKFNIAMEKHDYDNAHQAIKEILEIDPYEVSALVSLMELSYLRGKWNELSYAEKTINQSNRYISVETWDKVKSYKALALTAQRKFDKARTVLAEIKEPSVRERTTAEIDKLKKSNKRLP